MLSTFLDKASGLLNRRFLVAYWFPTFIAAVLAVLLRVWVYGVDASWRWWSRWVPTEDYAGEGSVQIWLFVGGLLLVTLIAYILQAFTRPLVQFYEGYYLPQRLRRWMTRRVERRWRRLRQERTEAARQSDLAQYAHVQDRLHNEYPDQAWLLLPTRLGNVLRSAERYSIRAYGMDAAFWWPRLWPLLPEKIQQEFEEVLTLMLALLNLVTLMVYVTIDSAIYLSYCQIENKEWVMLGVLVVGLLVVAVAYQGATAQARSYGQQIRSAVDLHRFELFKAMHYALPDTPQEEQALWGQLSQWLYNEDRGAARKLTYDHGKKEQLEAQAKNAGKTTKAKGDSFWEFLKRLWCQH